MRALEQADPELVEDLLLRRKWKNLQKDPSQALRMQSLDTQSYWQNLNSLPKKAVNQCVNKRIIEKDRVSCDRIL